MRIVSLFALLALSGSLLAGDWPQWRGPDRTAVSAEKGLLKKWPAKGPALVWKTDKAGQGYAGMAVVKGVVYTMGARGKDEYALAFDPKGKELWAVKLGPVHDWPENRWSYGPNATPTVANGRVYALSSKGMLKCLTTAGKPVWQKDLLADLGGAVNPVGGGDEKLGWGYSWSPLLDGDVLVVTPGGERGLFAGLDAKTGKPLWRSKGVKDALTYSSPVAATLAGTKQYVTVTQDGVVAVNAKGEELWRYKRPDPYGDIVATTPVISGDTVIVSVGYFGGLDFLKVTGEGGKLKVAKQAFSNKRALNSKQGGVALVGKHLYGFHEERSWACVDVATGKDVWRSSNRQLRAGGFVVADGRLYVFDEEGKLAMMEPAPKGKGKVLSSFKLPALAKNPKEQGKVWAHPSLSDGKLYVRDQELLYCYDVKGK